MISDDSLTEADDSFFDLYSTKKVTNTYNAVLEKLKSESSKSETVSNGQNDNVKKESKDEGEQDMPSLAQDEIIVLDRSARPVSIIEEAPARRRSSRLNRKAKNTDLLTLNSSVVKKRNKRNKSNKRKRKDQDVEMIEDITEEQNDINTSLDDEMNYEVSVKVIWKSVSVQTFRLRRFQKLTKIFEHFMKEENVPTEKILLRLKAKKVSPSDTPESLNLKVNDFIDGGVLSDSVNITSKPSTQINCSNEKDSIVIKVQDMAKNIFKFSINKNESVKSVMIRYAEQIETPLEKIKFYFDGEILTSSSTPASLGLDNDEIIDVKIMQ